MILVTNRSISRGDSSTEGAIGVTKNYTYYWKQVGFDNELYVDHEILINGSVLSTMLCT